MGTVLPIGDPGWKVWTAPEIYAPLPKLVWAIDSIAQRGTLGMLAAYGSSLKSWLELDLLDAVSEGRPWLGRFACGSGGEVFLLDYEAGAYETRRRLKLIAAGQQRDKASRVSFVTMPTSYLTQPELMRRLAPIAAVSRVICIDTLSAGSPGVDQNDTKFAEPLVALKALAERTNCVIIVLHHTRKSAKGGDDDVRELVRGTSALYNALDWGIALSKVGKTDYRCVCLKVRGGTEFRSFGVRVDDVEGGGVLVLAQDAQQEGQKESPMGALAKCKREILEMLATETLAQRVLTTKLSIYARVHGSQGTKVSALAELQDDGRISKEPPFMLKGR